MNPISTSFEWVTFLHGGYVAFVFGVLFFGALAFRQVLDNLAVQRLQMGEDLDSYLDASVAIGLLATWSSLILLVIVFYGILPATIYLYALPLILIVQCLQITLRTYFQRTLVKTRGIVVRSILFDAVKTANFDDIVVVRFVPGSLFVKVIIGLQNEEIGFRIFSFSAESLEHLLGRSTRAPILWSTDHPN